MFPNFCIQQLFIYDKQKWSHTEFTTHFTLRKSINYIINLMLFFPQLFMTCWKPWLCISHCVHAMFVCRLWQANLHCSCHDKFHPVL